MESNRPGEEAAVSSASDESAQDVSPRSISSSHASAETTPATCTTSSETTKTTTSTTVDPTNPTSIPTTHLKKSSLICFMVMIYCVCAIFSWIILCILSRRPIGVQSYYTTGTDFSESENFYQAGRVINAGVTTFTIPLASAVCARAAVTFAQQQRNGFTVRQVMALADQGWFNPEILLKLLFPKNWKRYGNSLIWLGLLLHILGFLIAPVQQLVLSQQTIKTPFYLDYVQVRDFSDISVQVVNAYSTTLLRSVLATATLNDAEDNLWLGSGNACDSTNLSTSGQQIRDTCTQGSGATTWSLAAQTNLLPFVTPLPASFNTGLVRQFAPRLNSSVTYDLVDASEFPPNCGNLPGAFYAAYNANANSFAYSLQACMPANQTNTVFKSTSRRQDISEVLYLNISTKTTLADRDAAVFRIQANSTAGYFELPNYLNGNSPGPLLQNGPQDLCDVHCLPQHGDLEFLDASSNRRRKFENTISASSIVNRSHVADPPGSISTEVLGNKPPLLAITVALFGMGSYIWTRTQNPTQYYGNASTSSNYTSYEIDMITGCSEPTPMWSLLSNNEYLSENFPPINRCVGLVTGDDITAEVADWLNLFWLEAAPSIDPTDPAPPTIYNMQPAFTAAVYLANLVQFTKLSNPPTMSLMVSYDLGTDTNIPVISTTGLIIVGILLGVFLLSLCVMAIYATSVPTWTATFNAFTMMRIGAAMTAEKIPLMMTANDNCDHVEILDSTPGWVGAVAQDGDEIARLELGAQMKLTGGKRKYQCYPMTKPARRHRKSFAFS